MRSLQGILNRGLILAYLKVTFINGYILVNFSGFIVITKFSTS